MVLDNGDPYQIMTQNQLLETYTGYGQAIGRQNYETTQTNQDANGNTTERTVVKSDSSPYYRKQ